MTSASKGQEVRDQGHLVEARALFQKCAQSACPAPIPKYCADWLADVVKKLPSLVVRAVDENDRDVTDAVADIDGNPVTLDGRAVDVDVGKHHIRIKRQGRVTFESDILAAQSEKDRVVVGKLLLEKTAGGGGGGGDVVEPPKKDEPTAPKGGVPTMSWIGWGIGAAGLISFTIFGLKARSDFDGFESSCGSQCTIENRDTVATSVTIADVSLVIGIVGVAVGTVFYLTRPKAAAPPPSNNVDTARGRSPSASLSLTPAFGPRAQTPAVWRW